MEIVNKRYAPDYSLIVGAGKPERGQYTFPKSIQEGDSPINREWSGIIPPPWPFDLLQSMYISNEMHSTCIDTKATDVNFSGFQINLIPEIESGKIKVNEEDVAAAKLEVEQFMRQCAIHPQIAIQMPFTSLSKEAWVDYETLGMYEFEVCRNAKGFIGALSPVPAQTIYVLTNEETRRRLGCRYMQRRFNATRYFLPYMGAVEITHNEFNPLTSPAEEFPAYKDREKWIRIKDVMPDAAFGDEIADEFSTGATELFVLPRPPFTKSTIYGTPAAVAAYPAILGLAFVDEYNKNFFISKGVPQWAVIIEGLAAPAVVTNEYSEEEIEDPTAALENTIREYFQQNLKRADRSVLVMSTFGTAKVTFHKMSEEVTDGSFDNLEVRYNERIRLAHHVPPAALGVSEITRSGSGKTNSGNGRELSQMMRYRTHIVSPEQRVLSSIVRAVLRGGLLIPYFDVTFNPLDIDEEVMQRTHLLDELKEGAITLNEYRRSSERYNRDSRPPLGDPDDAQNPANGIIVRTAQVTIFGADGVSTTAPGDSTPNTADDNKQPAPPDKNDKPTPALPTHAKKPR